MNGRSNNFFKEQHKNIPYVIIERAIHGDTLAINEVLGFYEPYINKLSSKILFDENGNGYNCKDTVLYNELKNKLILGIQKFNIKYGDAYD